MITANKLIDTELPALSPTDDPENAINLMDQFHVAHLPVIDQGKFLGIISETELFGAGDTLAEFIENEGDLLKCSVEPHEHILEVLKEAGEHQLTAIPVVSATGDFVGSIPLENLVNELSKMQGASQPGGILVIEMYEKDYSLQQISRIVEENDAKIISLSVSHGEENKIELNLKINKPGVNAIIQSFERFGYQVKGSYQEPEYSDDLKRRYDELMRYLNF